MSRSSTLFAMAADAEYGPGLKARITPVMIGVGPVEAAVNLTAELAARAQRGELPRLVVSLGSAGSRKLRHCEIYQVTSIAYRDIDASPLGFARGTTPLTDLPAVVPLPLRIPGVPEASLSTGGNVVSGAAYDLIDADMVDMETFAVWRACRKFAVPMLGLRGISDGKAELSHIGDWTEYLHVIDEKLAAIVDRILAGDVRGLNP
ncbi:5'-methylthioadenosine/S-adenosylhomocysteine nucleosidase [Pleomorphomonas carboxyditropha]|uniref:5'-methylthioadenosine/S-adenosylhomocysteine nucleosidase n=1 Tax=Pleomorphomonas carboxyditropha TaxID=2023338 RepID=A0A2G9WRN5_9HYPH|nr:5'-methylthioadenosine/S-adenosylhomocysteine nucleosidase [Pleomorphomonas carboxyditropha]PIO97378.1 5'-methylthioadenosine/S-adenosylhomocysteine nucleosidase [Pleomorphomonas carboxyditropha]